MRKEKIDKPDGRYIIYYWFDDESSDDDDAADASCQAERDEAGE
ncbi:MAG: hypothetical protein Q7T82_01670 [Armatimonadota bacterium]|nr:hypothetical protein [Armatimonadota bacterium]